MATKEKITIMNARLVFKNFAGKQTDFNAEGARNFCVVLNDELANDLLAKGWPVKVKPPREGYEDDGNFNTMKVNVKYSGGERDPKIFRICNGKQVLLTERSVGSLDWDDIVNVDLRVRPYNWDKLGKKGVTAYLESMYVTVEDDELARKYSQELEDDIMDPEDVPFA